MGRRRLFSQTIVESDVFLDMPLSSQALYFHLNMNADDDGFVNPKRIVRMIGANQDDLQILIAKRYVLAFQSGVIVIKHWLINNTIRGDRYHPTTYSAELNHLTKNDFGAYTEVDKITTVIRGENGSGNQMATNGIPSADILVPEVKLSEAKLSKVKLSEANINPDGLAEPAKKGLSKKIDGMFSYWESEVGYAVTSKVKQNREYCSKLLNEYQSPEIAMMIKAAALASEDQYSPGVSNFIDLYRKWDSLKLWGKKKGVKQNATAQF